MKYLYLLLFSSIIAFGDNLNSVDQTGNSISTEQKKKEYFEKIDSEKKRILLLREADKKIIKKVDSKTVVPRSIEKGQSMIIYAAKKNAFIKAAKLNLNTNEFNNCVNNSFTQEAINNCFKK